MVGHVWQWRKLWLAVDNNVTQLTSAVCNGQHQKTEELGVKDNQYKPKFEILCGQR
jgi:hypothetical protein